MSDRLPPSPADERHEPLMGDLDHSTPHAGWLINRAWGYEVLSTNRTQWVSTNELT
jgi:hypothetical protein